MFKRTGNSETLELALLARSFTEKMRRPGQPSDSVNSLELLRKYGDFCCPSSTQIQLPFVIALRQTLQLLMTSSRRVTGSPTLT